MSGKFSGQDLQRYRKLFNGARGGDLDLVRGLLSEGLLVNCAGPRGATPLHIAARFNQPMWRGGSTASAVSAACWGGARTGIHPCFICHIWMP